MNFHLLPLNARQRKIKFRILSSAFLFHRQGPPGENLLSIKYTVHEPPIALSNQVIFAGSTSLLCVLLSVVIVSIIQKSLLSLVICCPLSVSAGGEGATTLKKPCLDTICAALALHAHHHVMTLTSMHHPLQYTGTQECIYCTTHRDIYSTVTLTTLDRCSCTNKLGDQLTFVIKR